MAKKKKIKTQIGDLFAIPIGDSEYCYGQVVSEIEESGKVFPYTYIVYDFMGPIETPLEMIRTQEILLLFHTVDVDIEDGVWPIIGQADVPEHIKFPEYQQRKLGKLMVIGVDCKVIRAATVEDEKMLGTMKSVSPSVVVNLLKAHFGEGEWHEYYDDLIYNSYFRGDLQNLPDRMD